MFYFNRLAVLSIAFALDIVPFGATLAQGAMSHKTRQFFSPYSQTSPNNTIKKKNSILYLPFNSANCPPDVSFSKTVFVFTCCGWFHVSVWLAWNTKTDSRKKLVVNFRNWKSQSLFVKMQRRRQLPSDWTWQGWHYMFQLGWRGLPTLTVRKKIVVNCQDWKSQSLFLEMQWRWRLP
jgi:hypothetical protein